MVKIQHSFWITVPVLGIEDDFLNIIEIHLKTVSKYLTIRVLKALLLNLGKLNMTTVLTIT